MINVSVGFEVDVVLIRCLLLASSQNLVRFLGILGVRKAQESFCEACGCDVVMVLPGNTHGSPQNQRGVEGLKFATGKVGNQLQISGDNLREALVSATVQQLNSSELKSHSEAVLTDKLRKLFELLHIQRVDGVVLYYQGRDKHSLLEDVQSGLELPCSYQLLSDLD
ncbi:hypothetical protein HWI79_3582 [Cryptosporidium felis]|nr:hypothetical protein HWI79_3582 [Cryptosporidium felis]